MTEEFMDSACGDEPEPESIICEDCLENEEGDGEE
jgi:hypothetical protein